MRSRYFLASECAVYFPEAIPVCNSPTVNSSSSNAAGGALPGRLLAGDASLAATLRLTLARPIPLAMLWRTKFLRFIVNLAIRVRSPRVSKGYDRIQSDFLQSSPPYR